MKLDTSKFTNKKEMFDYLVKNKAELSEFKKTSLKFSDCLGALPIESGIVKSLNTNHVDNLEAGIIKRTIVANTYNWMDSHDDVHVDGIFAMSIKERGNKIWHLHDHEYKLTAKVGIPVSIYEKSVLWTDMGVNKAGSTMALFMDSDIKKSLNDSMFDAYRNGEIDQHSVGMIYVKMDLAVNDPDYKEEFATWNKYINSIGNKERAIEKGYFWAQKEAKLKEISAVLEGSNELTPTLSNIQSGKAAEVKESVSSARKVDYDYLTQHLKL